MPQPQLVSFAKVDASSTRAQPPPHSSSQKNLKRINQTPAASREPHRYVAAASQDGARTRLPLFWIRAVSREVAGARPPPLPDFTYPHRHEAVKGDHAAPLDQFATVEEFIRGPVLYTCRAGTVGQPGGERPL